MTRRSEPPAKVQVTGASISAHLAECAVCSGPARALDKNPTSAKPPFVKGDICRILASIEWPFMALFDQNDLGDEQTARTNYRLYHDPKFGKFRPCLIWDNDTILLFATFEGSDLDLLPAVYRLFAVPIFGNPQLRPGEQHLHWTPDLPDDNKCDYLVAIPFKFPRSVLEKWLCRGVHYKTNSAGHTVEYPDGTPFRFDQAALVLLKDIIAERMESFESLPLQTQRMYRDDYYVS